MDFLNNNLDKDQGSEIDISKKIMEKIKSNGIKMKSRWIFYMQALGLRSGFVLMLLILAFLMNILLYILKQNGALEFLDFGISGLNIVLANIPYDLIFLIFCFLIIANVIIKRFEIDHKIYFYGFSIFAVLVSVLCGVAIFATGINDAIREKISQNKKTVPIVNNFYGAKRLEMNDDNSLIGQIVQFKVIQEPFIIITKNGEIVTVVFDQKTAAPVFSPITVGQMIKAIGQRQQNNFTAQQIKLISSGEHSQPFFSPMPMTTIQVRFVQP